MNKNQELQMNSYYEELLKSNVITTLNEALIFKLSYEKAFSLTDVSHCADVEDDLEFTITKKAFTSQTDSGVLEIVIPYLNYKIKDWKVDDKVIIKHCG